nr:flagellar brake domain-containing protein [uncultured Tyzzerella sp.]
MDFLKGLFKKEEKDENILNLKVGTLLEIKQFNDDKMINCYNSKLQKIISDKEVVILVPIVNGKLIKLFNSNIYTIDFKTNKGLLRNKCKVLSYYLEDNIPFMKLSLLETSQVLQRRASYRLEASMSFDFDKVDNVSEKTLKSDDVLLSKGMTIDISSGGMKFFSNEDIGEGDNIKILLNGEDLFFVAIGNIIFKTENKNNSYKYTYKCKFENIPKKYVEAISKYIFEKQRDLSKKGKVIE